MEPKDYLERSGKGLITSLDINTIIISKKKKKERYAITNVSLKDISKILKEFEYLPYEGYVRKRSKHVSTDSYFYLARQLANFMMKFSMHVSPVRTQMANRQKMNNSYMSSQNIPNLHVCYSDESESKSINA